MSRAAQFGYLGICWVFLVLFLLKRWRERERRDAAETKRVMKSLLHDTSHQYEQDAVN